MDEHTIGRHDEAIDTLKEEMKLLRESVARIEQLLAVQRGGWITIATLMTAASAAGAFVWYVIDLVKR